MKRPIVHSVPAYLPFSFGLSFLMGMFLSGLAVAGDFDDFPPTKVFETPSCRVALSFAGQTSAGDSSIEFVEAGSGHALTAQTLSALSGDVSTNEGGLALRRIGEGANSQVHAVDIIEDNGSVRSVYMRTLGLASPQGFSDGNATKVKEHNAKQISIWVEALVAHAKVSQDVNKRKAKDVTVLGVNAYPVVSLENPVNIGQEQGLVRDDKKVSVTVLGNVKSKTAILGVTVGDHVNLEDAAEVAKVTGELTRRLTEYVEKSNKHVELVSYMTPVSGQDLKKNMKEYPQGVPVSVAAKWFSQLSKALMIFQRNNVVHRDVKPANIMIDNQGNVVVVDFGAAKILSKSSVESAILGTVAYTMGAGVVSHLEDARLSDDESVRNSMRGEPVVVSKDYDLFGALRTIESVLVQGVVRHPEFFGPNGNVGRAQAEKASPSKDDYFYAKFPGEKQDSYIPFLKNSLWSIYRRDVALGKRQAMSEVDEEAFKMMSTLTFYKEGFQSAEHLASFIDDINKMIAAYKVMPGASKKMLLNTLSTRFYNRYFNEVLSKTNEVGRSKLDTTTWFKIVFSDDALVQHLASQRVDLTPDAMKITQGHLQSLSETRSGSDSPRAVFYRHRPPTLEEQRVWDGREFWKTEVEFSSVKEGKTTVVKVTPQSLLENQKAPKVVLKKTGVKTGDEK